MRRVKQKELLYQLFWLFVVGSVGGFLLEGFWNMLRKGVWERHAATVVGPFCTIYGVALIVVYLLSRRLKSTPLGVQFVAYTCCCAVIEYLGSLLQEKMLGVTTWNYQKHPFQFQGRVSLDMSLLLGVGCCLFAWFILPKLLRLIQISPSKSRRAAVSAVLALLLIADIVLSEAAIFRWGERVQGDEPSTKMEALLDEVYGDERMEALFPNMKFSR